MTNSARNYCFTLNHYTDDDQERLRACFASNDSVKYIIWGRETASTGTPHLQGFIGFSTRKTLNQAKELINERAHLEVARGTPKQNRTYCTKDGDFEEFGDLPASAGSRSDLDGLASALRGGRRFRDLAMEYSSDFIRYPRGIDKYASFFKRETRPSVTVFCLWGSTGSGKTWRVFNTEPDLFRYAGDGWFDGYDQHEAVLFDDYRPSEFKIARLLQIIDVYPVTVRVKGSFVDFCPRRIYFTSNIKPEDWYKGVDEESHRALLRRIHICLEFLKVDDEIFITRNWPN